MPVMWCRLVALWAWPAIPGKSEELWALLALTGKPGETRGEAAAPHFGDPAFAGRKLAESRILFPRIDTSPAKPEATT